MVTAAPSSAQRHTWTQAFSPRRLLLIAGIGMLVLVLAVAYTMLSPNHTITQGDAGKTIKVSLRDQVTLELPSTLTMGNRWYVTSSGDDVLEQTHYDNGADDWLPGYDPGVTTIRFRAVHTGRTTLHLEYRNLHGSPAARTFEVTVNVKWFAF